MSCNARIGPLPNLEQHNTRQVDAFVPSGFICVGLVCSLCRGLGGDSKAEKQLVVLLSMPLSSRDTVTVLSLDQYPPLMSLLSRRTHKDMALRVVQAVLAQVGVLAVSMAQAPGTAMSTQLHRGTSS